MIDPLTSLAFSMHSGKGVYALLLGSGISRAAQIPTGWEVTLDLIRKVAAVEGEDCEPDPASWYVGKYQKEPDYSDLLAGLALTPAERTNALCGYFEASAEDLEEGKKTPTIAHKSIAKLVKAGYIRVIVTTNFDRLLEQALVAEGVDPTLISTPDMAVGAPPLAHSSCTVIKVHGDYRDSRLRNTVEELSAYDKRMNKLLDRIFDEYGLVVCGWSATWDEALRAAIQRCPNRRYSVFWATRGAVSGEAESLIKFRSAIAVTIESADKFFQSLRDKLASLDVLNAPHPLSAALAVISLKRYLVEDRFRIQLHDLVFDEVERQLVELSSLPIDVNQLSCDDLLQRMTIYESSLQILLAMMAHGCFWGTLEQAQIWPQVVIRLLGLTPPPRGNSLLLNLTRYPALLAFYVGGIAAVASGKYRTLKMLVKDARTSVDFATEGKDDLLVRKMAPYDILDHDNLNRCLKKNNKVPASEVLHKAVRETLRPLILSDKDYDDAFDRFEYLTALVAFDAQLDDGSYFWGAIGRFGYRNREPYSLGNGHVAEILIKELQKDGEKWPLLEAGLFADAEKYLAVAKGFNDQFLARFRTF